MTIRIAHLDEADHGAWLILARGYKAFYQTETSDAEYAIAWRRLLADDGIHAFGAWVDGRLVGITHYLFHTGTWTQTVCYLQDLYVNPASRGKGVARALIEAVAASARTRRATRMYWLTQAHNATARKLYDTMAEHRGFIRYDFPMDEPSA
ncbi:MAG: GNAT family N-acetyltransferase [Betaproteobacteria bacterium]|nr:GNAT family N-acetyltransferase [Betaproteobacteria bacterium]